MAPEGLRYWLLVGAAILATVLAWVLLPVEDWFRAFGEWTAGLGMLGPVAYAGLFAVATLLVIPCTPLTIAGALAFGWWALPVTLAAATVASWLAYVAGRWLLRERVRALIARRPGMRATVEAVGDGDWRLLTLMRLSPFVPFNAQNYALGAADVGTGAYLISTVAGMLPGTVVCVYLGVIGRAAGSDGPTQWLMLGLGLAATVAAVALTQRRVKAKLRARRDGRATA